MMGSRHGSGFNHGACRNKEVHVYLRFPKDTCVSLGSSSCSFFVLIRLIVRGDADSRGNRTPKIRRTPKIHTPGTYVRFEKNNFFSNTVPGTTRIGLYKVFRLRTCFFLRCTLGLQRLAGPDPGDRTEVRVPRPEFNCDKESKRSQIHEDLEGELPRR